MPLLSRLMMPFLGELLSKIRNASYSPDNEIVRMVFWNSIILYFVRSAGPKPVKEANWTRGTIGCVSSRCQDCPKLKQFLADPRCKVEHFMVSRARRKHLEQLLANSEYRVVTERNTRPETLVVTKGSALTKDTLLAWANRCTIAYKIVNELDREGLERVLGEDFKTLVHHKILKSTDDAPLPAFSSGPAQAPLKLIPVDDAASATSLEIPALDPSLTTSGRVYSWMTERGSFQPPNPRPATSGQTDTTSATTLAGRSPLLPPNPRPTTSNETGATTATAITGASQNLKRKHLVIIDLLDED